MRQPDSQTALVRWFQVVEQTEFHSFAELHAAFPSTDKVGEWIVFNIAGLLDTLGTLIRAYEETHFPMPHAGGAEVLRFLMEQHGLALTDLSEIGSQGVVSEILNGKRELNVRQIRALARRFHVSPTVFV